MGDKDNYYFEWLKGTDPDAIRTIIETSKDDIDVGYTMDSIRVEKENYLSYLNARLSSNNILVLAVRDKNGKIVAAGTVYAKEGLDFLEVLKFEFSRYFNNLEVTNSKNEKIRIYDTFVRGIYSFQKEYNDEANKSKEKGFERILVRKKGIGGIDASELTPCGANKITSFGYKRDVILGCEEDDKYGHKKNGEFGYKRDDIYDMEDVAALVSEKITRARITASEAASSFVKQEGLSDTIADATDKEHEQKEGVGKDDE